MGRALTGQIGNDGWSFQVEWTDIQLLVSWDDGTSWLNRQLAGVSSSDIIEMIVGHLLKKKLYIEIVGVELVSYFSLYQRGK